MTSIGFFRLKLRSGIAIVASGAKNAIMKEIINPFPVILKILKSIGARFTANFSWISVEAVSLRYNECNDTHKKDLKEVNTRNFKSIHT